MFRVFYPFVIHMSPFASLNGLLPDCDPDKLLPLESPPSVIIIPQDTPVDLAYETLFNAHKFQDSIVVWKNFTGTTMNGWSDYEYVTDHINMDAEYTFLRNFSNALSVSLKLKDAWHDMDNLYLGFNYNLLRDNANTLYEQLKASVSNKGKAVYNLIPYENSMHHAFLYKGKKYSTGMHQAPASDWFFQLGNAKVWRFVHPRYTPYIKPVTLDSISLNSRYDFLPDETRIPYVDVTTNTGDLMFFPPHWWHQVENLEDGVGIGIGFRPFDDFAQAFKSCLFPWTVNYGALSMHRMGFILGAIKRKMMLSITTTSTSSGLNQRSFHVCKMVEGISTYVEGGWSWNKKSQEFTDLPIGGSCNDFPKDLWEWEPEKVESSAKEEL